MKKASDAKHLWKKNYRRVPDSLLSKVRSLSPKLVVVSCTRVLPKEKVEQGDFEHVGIQWDKTSGVVKYAERILPRPSIGKYSDLNLNGKEIKRKDLPKVTRTFTWETPNWGDSYNGYHDISIDREVYQVDFIPPQELEIRVELLNQQSADNREYFVFKFEIDNVLDPKAKDFQDDLLYSVNLLQENVGKADVFASDASRDDYLKTVAVNWEILPPGERTDTIRRILEKYRAVTPDDVKHIEQRYDLLSALKPEAWISGTSGFQRYFGAKFKDNLVVFENLRYGNAAYVMYDEWASLSQRSRLALLAGNKDGFERIVHADGWQKRLKTLLKSKLN